MAAKADPISVILPASMKKLVSAEAARRGLKLSPAIRVLVSERLQEIEDSEQMSRAEEWQRAQAWATWSEGPREADDAELESVFSVTKRKPTRLKR